MKKRLRAAGAVLLLKLLAGTLTLTEAGQVPGDRGIDFDHLVGGDTTYTLHNLKDGEWFTINILNTCESTFSYEIRGITLQEPTRDPDRIEKGNNILGTKSLPVPHNTAYGGYVVNISRDPQGDPCLASGNLRSETLIVFTPERDNWAIGFSSGFTVSGLTDPGNKDFVQLGIAAFVHTYHRRWKYSWLAPMFALGIRDPYQTEYYFGIGARLGDKATLNIGGVVGPTASSLW